jgi:hypothetical protein
VRRRQVGGVNERRHKRMDYFFNPCTHTRRGAGAARTRTGGGDTRRSVASASRLSSLTLHRSRSCWKLPHASAELARKHCLTAVTRLPHFLLMEVFSDSLALLPNRKPSI